MVVVILLSSSSLCCKYNNVHKILAMLVPNILIDGIENYEHVDDIAIMTNVGDWNFLYILYDFKI